MPSKTQSMGHVANKPTSRGVPETHERKDQEKKECVISCAASPGDGMGRTFKNGVWGHAKPMMVLATPSIATHAKPMMVEGQPQMGVEGASSVASASSTAPSVAVAAKAKMEGWRLWTVEECVQWLTSLGSAFAAYRSGIVDNAISGEILQLIADEPIDLEALKMLEDAGITNILHRRVIRKHLNSMLLAKK